MFKKFIFTMMLIALFVYASTPEIKECVEKNVGKFYEINNVLVTPTIENVKDNYLYINGKVVKIGGDYADVIDTFGDVGRVDLSEYGFEWFIYNNDYKNYIQIGIDNGKVAGIYTNSNNFLFKNIKVGISKNEVLNSLGEPLEYIKKGNVRYQISASEQKSVYLIDKTCFLTIFYDMHKNDTVTAIQIIDKAVEYSLKGFFGKPTDALKESFERQTLDLVNSIRVREGLEILEWDSRAAAAARGHSEDMFERAYFSHETPEGIDPFERMKKKGLKFSLAGENIAYGMPSAIYAHELWMNSEGHRVNILKPEFTRLGIGAVLTETDGIYLTQDFYTPPKIMG